MVKRPQLTSDALEARCLAAVRKTAGCKHIKRVELAKVEGCQPNWRLTATHPDLSAALLLDAHEVIEPLRIRYLMV